MLAPVMPRRLCNIPRRGGLAGRREFHARGAKRPDQRVCGAKLLLLSVTLPLLSGSAFAQNPLTSFHTQKEEKKLTPEEQERRKQLDTDYKAATNKVRSESSRPPSDVGGGSPAVHCLGRHRRRPPHPNCCCPLSCGPFTDGTREERHHLWHSAEFAAHEKGDSRYHVAQGRAPKEGCCAALAIIGCTGRRPLGA